MHPSGVILTARAVRRFRDFGVIPSVFSNQDWLVVSTPLKNMKVNWDDEIPNIWENIKCSKPPTRRSGDIQGGSWGPVGPREIQTSRCILSDGNFYPNMGGWQANHLGYQRATMICFFLLLLLSCQKNITRVWSVENSRPSPLQNILKKNVNVINVDNQGVDIQSECDKYIYIYIYIYKYDKCFFAALGIKRPFSRLVVNKQSGALGDRDFLNPISP